ncbi:dihydrolipoamide acetyltransferase family protein [Halorarum salinum]|uniref:2-oxo acid dehydrogenase subunit E2 n=1 Tax=Halorarum salinum TaxID=2743089 RepID=A0A7D5L813_9EURY|nr:dihydrolipoamide acetyltransferase family protein [Halobaculum salinum]QLG60293.1 2-oxo acid dehydrogenase subunit E2 [Halobaculum salinum]
MEKGTVIKWLVETGNAVDSGDPVVVVESDKTSFKLCAEESGQLLDKAVTETETVPVGTLLGRIGTPNEIDDTLDQVGPEVGSSANPIGGPPSGGTTEDEDDDRSIVRATPSARKLAREHGLELETVAATVGKRRLDRDDVLALLDKRPTNVSRGEDMKSTSVSPNRAKERDPPDEVQEGEKRMSHQGNTPERDNRSRGKNTGERKNAVLASPRARVVAEEYGVDLSVVAERLDEDELRESDVKAYVRQYAAFEDHTSIQSQRDSQRSAPSIAETVPIEGPREVMFEQMGRAAGEYANTTTMIRVDVTDLVELRVRLSEAWTVDLSYTAFVVRAVADALSSEEYRLLNASISDQTIDTYSDINVGIAVNTDRGLLVPTIYHADEITIRDLSEEIDELATAAREGRLDPVELQNGTFSVSNAGQLGAYLNTPQIRPPQTAVLGMCTIFEDAGIVEGEIEPRKFMHLTLTYDHRVVEGATAVSFLQELQSSIESPESLLS